MTTSHVFPVIAQVLFALAGALVLAGSSELLATAVAVAAFALVRSTLGRRYAKLTP